MADPSTYRPAPGSIPVEPGVYRFRDSNGRVLYVGKAKSLRSRLNSYFADLAGLQPRTRNMVTSAAGVEWTVVSTEVEALQLEYNWIKEFDPPFNVRYKDDKSYPVLAVTMGEEIPRLFVYRGPRRKGVRYFGPYSHAWAIRETLDLLLRVFPARTCSAGVLRRHQQLGRPCLLGYIDKCSAPCTGAVTVDEHRQIVNDFCDFLAGKTDRLVRDLEKQMATASESLDFERAARLRDDIGALRTALEKQSVVFGDGTDADVVAFAHDELEVAVQVFHVRGGRVRGQRGWVNERIGEPNRSDIVEEFLTQFYGEQQADSNEESPGGSSPIPRLILVPELPQDVDLVELWLSEKKGSNVRVRVPQRGDKKTLAETVHRNAVEALAQHKMKRAGDLTARSAALQELQETLELDTAPLRIECVDISHVQGTDVVGSLVVFEDGLPKKSDYRHYSIKEAAGDGRSDDVGSIAEVTRRRFMRHKADALPLDVPLENTPGLDPETGRPKRFAYPPNVFIVDGGAPQVNAAAAVLDELGITDVSVIGLAKRLEEVWLPNDPYPAILSRSSDALFLLQRVRDEAHRFAITYHRSKRSRRMTASVLDSIPGLGQVRKTALVTHFGSVANLKSATVEEIVEVPGIGAHTAQAIYESLHQVSSPQVTPESAAVE
ncbi:excinuclease ABC subunit UvrC [Hoyosella rhizosphaerae]|uniref:UvrABC system protein C n=1 Tax=Hoyosella rhizosphaerae TaxID=1755582 RepID=A0A916U3K7_9ACTN|nr:excinuclease ABC subunit UvrC [Hoyosella rhizosphaerae]MBN4926481.1 excinuclease ABC subunit UvrC [Hoyosella rhizosphaerae]GGC59016.1 UvrABC system protein C [Hoyosella rhizosphaerae]